MRSTSAMREEREGVCMCAVAICSGEEEFWPGEGATETGGGEAAPGPASPRLESKDNNRTLKDLIGRIIFVHQRCNSRTCSSCGPRLGYIVRQRLLEKHDLFKVPALLTLTVDRKNFESPGAAHHSINEFGLIRRLMRYLDVQCWVWILEFQKRSGTGWPHWHILIDLSNQVGQKLDLSRAWRLWRDQWGVGGVDIQQRRNFQEPSHAINYITKYLMKQPKVGFPLWVIEATKRIRLCGSAKAIGALIARPGIKAPAGDDEETPREAAKPRPLIERMSECGTRATAFFEWFDPETGEMKKTYAGVVSASPSRLLTLSKLSRLDTSIVGETMSKEQPGGTVEPWSRATIPAVSRFSIKKIVEGLQVELANLGEFDHVNQLSNDKQKRIREFNGFDRQDEPEEGGGNEDQNEAA